MAQGAVKTPGKRSQAVSAKKQAILSAALETFSQFGIHGTRLEQVADHPLELNQGTLYPALVRLEQRGWIKGSWQKTENNRDAKYYAITKTGQRALGEQTERWRRISGLVNKLLASES